MTERQPPNMHMDEVLRCWFEQDFITLQQKGYELLPSVLLRGTEQECDAFYLQQLSDGNDEMAAAAVIAAINAIWDSCSGFSRFAKWLERLDRLLENEAISTLTYAALELNRLIVNIIWRAPLNELSAQIMQGAARIDASGSAALGMLYATASAYVLTMKGHFYAADQCLTEASYLQPNDKLLIVPALHLAAGRCLLDTVSGKRSDAGRALEALLNNPLVSALPASLTLLARCNLLLCHASHGEQSALAEVTARLRAIVIPEHKSYAHAYLHFSLGVAALMRHRPSEALTHAIMAHELGGLCDSIPAQYLSALLKLQSLVDLDEEMEAVKAIEHWLPLWQKQGFQMLATAACLELAKLHVKHDQIKDANLFLAQAKQLLPKGETLPDYHRAIGFAAELEKVLANMPSQIAGKNTLDTLDIKLRVTTLGCFHVQIGENTIYDRNWRGNRTKLLLKALITLGGQKVSLERLCDLLWPEADGQQARQNLKVTMSRLRHLGQPNTLESEAWLVQKQGAVSLRHDCCEVDVFEFVERSASQSLAERISALELYQGEFLPNDDSAIWIIEHRQHLNNIYIELVRSLALQPLAADQMQHLEKHLLRVVELDPLDERSYEALMRCYLIGGRHALAAKVYHQAEEILKAKIGAQPGKILREMYAALALQQRADVTVC